MDRFVTVAIFNLPHELAVVRAKLETEGIICLARDEHTLSAYPLFTMAIGGLRLQVPLEDAEEARAILREAGYEVEGE